MWQSWAIKVAFSNDKLTYLQQIIFNALVNYPKNMTEPANSALAKGRVQNRLSTSSFLFFANIFENKTGALLVEGSVDFLLLYTWQSPRLVKVVLLTQARFTANFVVIVISLKLFRIRAVSLAKTPESLPIQKLTYCPFLL